MTNDITEQNLIDFLKIILEIEGEISLIEFKIRVKNAFNLNAHDLTQSPTRPNEVMYEQRCRNLNSHNNFPSNLISYDNTIFKSR